MTDGGPGPTKAGYPPETHPDDEHDPALPPPADETPTASALRGEEDRVTMALTLRPAVANPQPHRLRRAATAPVPVLLVASALTTGLLVVLADLVAKLG